MSPTKLLQINPTLFSVNSNGNNKSIKINTKPEIRNNKMNPNRKVLLAKIKDFQKKGNENKHQEKQNNSSDKSKTPNEEDIQDFEGEFNKSLNFLQELSNKHTLKRRDKKNRTIKKTPDVENNIHLDLPQELKETEIIIQYPPKQPINTEPSYKSNDVHILPCASAFVSNDTSVIMHPPLTQHSLHEPNKETFVLTNHILPPPPPIIQMQPPLSLTMPSTTPPPPYSNLKGSLKPTYREWLQKTQKNYKNKNTNISFSDKNQVSQISESKLNQPSSINSTLNLSSISNESNQKQKNTTQFRNKMNKPNIVLTRIPVEKINKKTRTIKYTLGKKGNKIGVLIKNSNTRKKIKDDFLKLKRKNISEIKDTLRNKNLIKAGTLAPNDVLREIYEQSILTGDVVNKNKDALIHNYFSNN